MKKKELIAENANLHTKLRCEQNVSAHFIEENKKLKQLINLLATTLDTLNAEIIVCRKHIKELLEVGK